MNRRVYVHTFFDIVGTYIKIESEKKLKDIEWEVKENKHNIWVFADTIRNIKLPKVDPKNDDII